MKKILFCIFIGLLSFAHTPDILLSDNHDGTMDLSVKFPGDPGDAAGANIYMVLDKPYNGSSETINGNLVILKRTLDISEEITLIKPKTKKYYLHIYVMKDHEYDLVEVPVLTKKEKDLWEEKIKNDTELTDKEKNALLGISCE